MRMHFAQLSESTFIVHNLVEISSGCHKNRQYDIVLHNGAPNTSTMIPED